MRRIPLSCARQLGRATRLWRGFPFLYIAVMFFLLPVVFLGISFMFEQDSKGLTVLGSFIVTILGLGAIYTAYYCQYKGGKENCVECLGRREVRRQTMTELPEDMQYLKSVVAGLVDHTGFIIPEEVPVTATAAEVENEVTAADKGLLEKATAEEEDQDNYSGEETAEEHEA